jgi:predicted transcriptional regulator
VYRYLADRANKDGICWPSIPTISKDLKFSESTIRRALKDLHRAGLVQAEQRYRENGSNSSLQYLLR